MRATFETSGKWKVMSVCSTALMICLRTCAHEWPSSFPNTFSPGCCRVRNMVARWWLSNTLASLYVSASSCLVAIRNALLTPACASHSHIALLL